MARSFVAAAAATVLAVTGAALAGECYTSTNVDSLTLTRGAGSFKGSIDIWGNNCIGVTYTVQFSNDNQYSCTWDANGKERYNLTVSDATYGFDCAAVDRATLDAGYFNLVYLGVNWEYESYASVYEGDFPQ